MPVELLKQIERHALATPHRAAYVETATGCSMSFRQLVDRFHALRAHTRTALNAGDVVLLRCANSVEFAPWLLALLSNGLRVLPVSLELTISELRSLVARASVRAIVADDASRRALVNHVPTGWSPDCVCDRHTERSDSSPTGELLLASSGTTGEPKIVRRTSTSLDAVAKNMVDAIGFRQTDHVLACVPLSHSYGIEHGLLAPLWAGATVHLCEGMDLPRMATALTTNITIWPAVPSMIETLTAVSDAPEKLPQLRTVYTAGAPLPHNVYERFHERYRVRVGQLYGMTEIGSVIYSDPSSPTFNPTSVGQPMRDVSVRVLDENADGEGEIAIAATSMCSGYVAGELPLVDGHFRTGDLGRLDAHGNLVITGRIRLLIESGGVKVNPLEVETVLATHTGVAECVVVPVKQSDTLNRIKAIILPRDFANPPEVNELRQFARERLAAYKVPRSFEFVASLPRTAAGKVNRKLLE